MGVCHLRFIVASPGITDYDGGSKKARRRGLRHWYVNALSNPHPYENLQVECDQIAMYVRNHILSDFCMDCPAPALISNMRKVGEHGDSDTHLTFEEARQKLGVIVTANPASQSIPSTSAWSKGPPMVTDPGASSSSAGPLADAPATAPPPAVELSPIVEMSPATLDDTEASMSPITPDDVPDWGDGEPEPRLVVELLDSPAPTPHQVDQDRELKGMSTTPHILEQAAVYLDAQGSKPAPITVPGIDQRPLCTAVSQCSVNVTPVNNVGAWTPFQTPAPSQLASPRGDQGEQEPSDIMLTAGIRKLSDGTVVLEPLWYQARSIIWLLGVRKQVQDDGSS